MHVLKVQLFNYRFNSVYHKGPTNAICYKLSEDNDEIEGKCMDHTQLTQLTNYIAANKENFGYSSYHNCDPDDAPEMTEYDLFSKKTQLPDYLILRSENKIRPGNGDIFNWMDIALFTDNGSVKPPLALPFNLIFKVEH